MADCDFRREGSVLVCANCGRVYSGNYVDQPEMLHLLPCRNSPKTYGCGDCLHDAILRWVGEVPTRQCSCEDRIRQMNSWGPENCRQNVEEIVDWLVAEATARGWWRFFFCAPGSRFFARRFVLLAVRDSELRQKSEKNL
jgi:hypothetical protein